MGKGRGGRGQAWTYGLFKDALAQAHHTPRFLPASFFKFRGAMGGTPAKPPPEATIKFAASNIDQFNNVQLGAASATGSTQGRIIGARGNTPKAPTQRSPQTSGGRGAQTAEPPPPPGGCIEQPEKERDEWSEPRWERVAGAIFSTRRGERSLLPSACPANGSAQAAAATAFSGARDAAIVALGGHLGSSCRSETGPRDFLPPETG